MNSKTRVFLAFVLLALYYRAPIAEYAGDIVDKVSSVSSVVEIEKPSDKVIGSIEETGIDEYDYTAKDVVLLSIFFDKFADNLLKIEEGSTNELVLNHFADSINSYLFVHKLDQKYSGLTSDIRDLFLNVVSPNKDYGTLKSEDIVEMSEVSRGIAWVISNRG
jgi:hypothetical protein